MEPPMTTIDCLKDDNIEEILLRLPSPASLARAALASIRWRRVASRRGFLGRFREAHPSSSSSSSHLLVGLFAFHDGGGLPVFHLAPPVRSDPDLAAIARGSDFRLTRLDDDPAWRLRDCHDGLLLLSRSGGGPLTVYDPVSLRRVTIRRPQLDGDGVIFPADGYILDSLIRRRGAKSSAFFSFRVVSVQVQHHGRPSRLRAVVYDSGTSRWRFHPWREDDLGYGSLFQSRHQRPTMQAAGLIFFRRRQLHPSITSSCSVLNTATMDFFRLPWPACGLEESSYVVGETEHGACCLACVDNVRRVFQLWLLVREEGSFGAGGKAWKLEKETPVSEVVPHGCHHWCHVTTVAAGIALVRAGESRHFAVGLKDLKTKAEFCDHGSGLAYLFQLPWAAN